TRRVAKVDGVPSAERADKMGARQRETPVCFAPGKTTEDKLPVVLSGLLSNPGRPVAGSIRPKSIGLRLGPTPGTTFTDPLDLGIELPPAERFHPAMKGSRAWPVSRTPWAGPSSRSRASAS